MGVDGRRGAAWDDAEMRSSRLAAIVESSTDAIIGKTLDGIVITWNTGAADMYGFTADEMIGRNVSVIFPPDRTGELASILERLRQGERVEHFETKRTRKDGSVIEVSVSVSPIRDASGEITGAATVARDITERRAHEARIRQTERMETVGQLAGGIAHDFNNMLGAIMGYAALIAGETADQPALRADVEEILAIAGRAAGLTRELLIFSRKEPSQPQTISLNSIVNGVRGLLTASVGSHITLQVDLATDLPAVQADRGRIEQVLVNLAVNARDAMPDGGTLTITTGQTQLDEKAARVLGPQAAPGTYAEITVRDTGTGISPWAMCHIFEPFFTTKELARSSGLGLSTVYGTVTDSAGTITVDSEEGVGTIFHIYLPAIGSLAEAPAVPAARQAPEGAADWAGPDWAEQAWAGLAQGNGETVLVVDDEPAMLQAASRILRLNGYTTLEASTGNEALSLLSSREFSLLLTDSVVPDMTGNALADDARRLKPGLRVLQMSGDIPSVTAGDAMAFIKKPFTSAALLDKVHAVLDAPLT